MPVFNTGLWTLGNDATWTPVWRKEVSYTASVNLTKVQGRHEIRSGFDFVRLTLDHWQPEIGNPRGDAHVRRRHHRHSRATPGVGGWNSYAAFLLGQMSGYGKSVQFEEMTGRENQYGLYVSDRWQVNEKLTVNLGLRYEYYPLMSRADRGLEQLDYNTFMIRLGGLGGNPEGPRHQGGQGALRAAPRPRLPHQREHGVPRRLRQDVQPAAVVAADARVLSGDDRLQRCRRRTASSPTAPSRTAFPARRTRTSRAATSRCRAASTCARPIRTMSSAGHTQSWNMFIERRLPLDVSVSARLRRHARPMTATPT